MFCDTAACASAWSEEISAKSSYEDPLVLVADQNDAMPLWKEEAEKRRAEAEAAAASAASRLAQEEAAATAGYPAASAQPEAPAQPESKAAEESTTAKPDEEMKKEKNEKDTKKTAPKASAKKTKAKAKPKSRPPSTSPTEEKPKEEPAPAKSSPHLRPELDVSGLSADQKQKECKYFAESTSASGSLLYQMIDGQLAPVAHFVTEPAFEKFAKACYEHKFIEGRGTIGRTYHAKLPEFLQDARKASPVLMIRKKIAMAHNLKSFYCAAFGNGIIEVFSASVWGSPPSLVDRPGA